MLFEVWGARGSFPISGEEFTVYGGSTSCFSVRCGDSLVVFDAGSGLAALGENLSRGGDVESVHILLGHAHIDHVAGLLPFLSSAERGGITHIYGDSGVLDSLGTLMDTPFWPCPLGMSGARLHRIAAGEDFRLSDGEPGVRLSAMGGTHPGGCLWYRLEYMGRRVVYMLDCEPDMNRMPEMSGFARDASLLVWDASWPPGEEKPGWGHSSWRKGAEFAESTGAERVLMAHHAFGADDRTLEKAEREAAALYSGCIFARERLKIEL